MRNNPENIYKYWQNHATATAVDLNIINQISIDKRGKYASMQRIEVLGEIYYTLPLDDSDMGASEKIPLISKDSFEKSIENGTELEANAMLKLPKNKVTTQVQSEGMAIGIASQALGLNATKATMVCFNDKPALFVPFDPMIPLKKFAAGDVKIERKKRTDYEDSSLNPLGPGLSANVFANDFGSAFGLTYLTGDSDGMGGANQNKGLIGRELYIFDQAITGHDNMFAKNLFTIDSRLRQKPKPLASLSRHTKGRNFSLLEDANIAEKFDSLNEEKCEKTIKYINEVINGLKKDIDNVPEHLKDQHLTLIKSAENALETVQSRIDNYKKMLPATINVEPNTIKNALILENILNNPRLYSLTGRPYRSLFCNNEHSLKITNLETVNTTDVKISFNKNLNMSTLARINRHLGETNIKYDSKTNSLEINKELLTNLENVFYPENDMNLNHEMNYLDNNDSKIITKAYNNSDHYLVKLFKKYNEIKNKDLSDQTTISLLDAVRNKLNATLQNSNKDLGFNMHMIKRFEFETQKELQKIFLKNNNLDEKKSLMEIQNQAFSSAIKLDCIQEYNKACLHAAKNINDPAIQQSMLELMIKYSHLTYGHHDLAHATIDEAKYLRQEMLTDIDRVLAIKPIKDAHVISKKKEELQNFKSVIKDLKNSPNQEINTTQNIENTNLNTPKI